MSKKNKKKEDLSLYGLATHKVKLKEDKEPKKKAKYKGIYDVNLANEHADILEDYLNTVTQFCVFTNMSRKEYEETIEEWHKIIKNLRKGNYDKVYDKDRYMKYMQMK